MDLAITAHKDDSVIGLVCRHYFTEQQRLHPETPFTPFDSLLGSDDPQCREPAVQKKVATFILVLNLVTGILSAVVTPKLGHMSDRFGRTPLMAVASCGGLVAGLVFILAATFPDVIDHRWLILEAVFDGMGGSLAAGSILSQSYASDCSSPSTRAVSFGAITAMLFSGLALGPLLAGYFVEWTGSLVAIFYVGFCCHLLFIVMTALIIPESLSREKQKAARELHRKEVEARGRQPTSWLALARDSNPLTSVKKAVWVTGPGANTRLRINLLVLAFSDAIIVGVALAAGAVVLLYAEATFGWGNLETSRFVSGLSLVRVMSLTVVLPAVNYLGRTLPAARRRRRRSASGDQRVAAEERNAGADRLDLWTIRAALASDMLGCAGYITARSEAAFVSSAMLTALGGLAAATVQSVVTKHIPAERVGQVLGAMGTMEALGRVVGPLIFNGLYAVTVGSYPQAIFVLLMGLFALVFVGSFAIKTGVHLVEEGRDEAADEPVAGRAEAAAALALSEEQMLAQ
ncbi:putative membrane protein [Escovopsis weberi]|uniref:Putative membrane protein n=1 Tax=Escovopsis weberi TaxID=150374 RepID=A0A0M8N136_ESCWE|nr:putative membrane protein [Escovopsis weberi]